MSKHNIPKPQSYIIKKSEIIKKLKEIDNNNESKKRILKLEVAIRNWIASHIAALPEKSSTLRKFNTNPFVLMFYTKQRGYSTIAELEKDILPAKLFSSMETSSGRMVQELILPVWDWKNVDSAMHSTGSVIDCIKKDKTVLNMITLKSGPRCLNDEMSKDIATDIVQHAEEWAESEKVDHIRFSYCVIYGTKKISNKKDWHILRNIVETVGQRYVTVSPESRWDCSFNLRNIRVDVNIKIGEEFWNDICGANALVEVCIALIRSCTIPIQEDKVKTAFSISDLGQIISTDFLSSAFNVSILQRSQIEWLFFLMSHYCDQIIN